MKQLFLSLFVSLQLASFAQTATKEALFTIDSKPYYTDEFLRVYNKNLDLVKDESQKDLNNYLNLFIGYKLKVNKDFVTPQFVQCFSVFSIFAQAGDLAIISLLDFDQLLFAK